MGPILMQVHSADPNASRRRNSAVRRVSEESPSRADDSLPRRVERHRRGRRHVQRVDPAHHRDRHPAIEHLLRLS